MNITFAKIEDNKSHTNFCSTVPVYNIASKHNTYFTYAYWTDRVVRVRLTWKKHQSAK